MTTEQIDLLQKRVKEIRERAEKAVHGDVSNALSRQDIPWLLDQLALVERLGRERFVEMVKERDVALAEHKQMWDQLALEQKRVKELELQVASLEDDAAIGQRWKQNSSLELWFPFTADRLKDLEAHEKHLEGRVKELEAKLQMLASPEQMGRTEQCQKILVALAGARICTPEETYGSDTNWAISDAIQAIHKQSAELQQLRAELEQAKTLISCETIEALLGCINKAYEKQIEQLRAELAMATDAANKGDLARQTAGGMELEIQELRAENATLKAACEKWSNAELLGETERQELNRLRAERDELRAQTKEYRRCVDELAQIVFYKAGETGKAALESYAKLPKQDATPGSPAL